MGAQASSVHDGGRPLETSSGKYDIEEPLLRERQLVAASPWMQHRATTSSQYSCPSSVSSSAPPSFKQMRPRKTQDFIGRERVRTEESGGGEWRHEAEDLDPRLFEENDSQVNTKVASLLFQHIKESASNSDDEPETDEFHKAHFLKRGFCAGCCSRCFKSKAVEEAISQEAIFDLLDEVAQSLYFCKQVVMMCTIYIERLLGQTSVMLTSGNWSMLVIVGMLVASKVWEDVHPWNADFEACLKDVCGLHFKHGAMFRLEMLFLERLRWEVFVDGEIYISYLFSILEDGRPDPAVIDNRRLMRGHSADFFNMETIAEIVELGEELSGDEEEGVDRCRHSRSPSGFSPSDFRALTVETSPSEFRGLERVQSPLQPSQVPWSRDSLVDSWRTSVRRSVRKTHGQASALRAMHDAWRLEARNPHIGALRHAPRAAAPSRHIHHSAEVRWSRELERLGSEIFGPRLNRRPSEASQKIPDESADESEDDDEDFPGAGVQLSTISGATGAMLASELAKSLGQDRRRTVPAGAAAAKPSMSQLEESMFCPDPPRLEQQQDRGNPAQAKPSSSELEKRLFFAA